MTGCGVRLSTDMDRPPHCITHEAVTNALKYGGPSRIDLDLSYEPRLLTLAIRDHCRGIDHVDVETAAHDGHWGIKRMGERAARHGGTLENPNWHGPRLHGHASPEDRPSSRLTYPSATGVPSYAILRSFPGSGRIATGTCVPTPGPLWTLREAIERSTTVMN